MSEDEETYVYSMPAEEQKTKKSYKKLLIISIIIIAAIIPLLFLIETSKEVPLSYEIIKPAHFTEKYHMRAEEVIKNTDNEPGNFSIIFTFTDTEGKKIDYTVGPI